MTQQQTIVAVLAGGDGQRMGGNKACVSLAGRPLISYPLDAARDAGLEAIVVAKRATALPALEEAVLHEPHEPTHPLCGVLSALDFAGGRRPAPGVLFVGCDMPFLSAELLRWLAAFDGPLVTELQGRLQPLPIVLAPSAATPLSISLRACQSLRGGFEALRPRVLRASELSPFGEPARLCASVNTRAQLSAAEQTVMGTLQ